MSNKIKGTRFTVYKNENFEDEIANGVLSGWAISDAGEDETEFGYYLHFDGKKKIYSISLSVAALKEMLSAATGLIPQPDKVAYGSAGDVLGASKKGDALLEWFNPAPLVQDTNAKCCGGGCCQD